MDHFLFRMIQSNLKLYFNLNKQDWIDIWKQKRIINEFDYLIDRG